MRISLWSTLVTSIALVLAIPIFVILANVFVPTGDVWQHLYTTVLSDYVVNSLLLMVGVAMGSLLLGVTAAWLVSMTEFPGRKHFEWALLLPMAVPAYIIAYTYTGMLDFAGPLQTSLREITGWGYGDYWFPEVRSLEGAAIMMTLVLYPYIYLLTRAAFLSQSLCVLEVSRSLGNGPWKTFFTVALPLARPAVIAGLSLVLMETLADYGTVEYFGVATFTTGIFRTWYGLDNASAAAQLAAILLLFVFVLLTLERYSRRKARYHNTSRRHQAVGRFQLQGWNKLAAILICFFMLLFGFLLPAAQLGIWAFDTAAKIIQRDYTYETNLKSPQTDGIQYPSVSPILCPTIGVNLTVSNRISMKMSASYHYTFTDWIDDISSKSTPDRRGNKGTDKYIYTSFSLQYDLGAPKYDTYKRKDNDEQEDADPYMLVLDELDSDRDGVPDVYDKCPRTPVGVDVDKKGCPHDKDKDGIPDHLDKDNKTRKGAMVDLTGVEILEGSGSTAPLKYKKYVSEEDSAYYAMIAREDSILKAQNVAERIAVTTPPSASEDTIVEELPSIDDPEDIVDTLAYGITVSIEEQATDSQNLDSALYIGEALTTLDDTADIDFLNIDSEEETNATTIDDAGSVGEKIFTQMEEVAESPTPKPTLSAENTSAQSEEVDSSNEGITPENTKYASTKTPFKMPMGVIYRVQVGAYQEEVPLERVNAILNIDGLTQEISPEGLTIFAVGEFRNEAAAEELRQVIANKGIEDAFVIAFNNGERVTIPEARNLEKPPE